MKKYLFYLVFVLISISGFGQTAVFSDVPAINNLAFSSLEAKMVSFKGEHIITMGGFDPTNRRAGTMVVKLDTLDQMSLIQYEEDIFSNLNDVCQTVFKDDLLIVSSIYLDCDLVSPPGFLFITENDTLFFESEERFGEICQLSVFGSKEGMGIYSFIVVSQIGFSHYWVDFNCDMVLESVLDYPKEWKDNRSGIVSNFHQVGDTIFYLLSGKPNAGLWSELGPSIYNNDKEIKDWVKRESGNKTDFVAITKANEVFVFDLSLNLDTTFALPFTPRNVVSDGGSVLFWTTWPEHNYALWNDSLVVGEIDDRPNHEIIGHSIRNDELYLIGIQDYVNTSSTYMSPNILFVQSGSDIELNPNNDLNFLSFKYESSLALNCPGFDQLDTTEGYRLKDVEITIANDGLDTILSFYFGAEFSVGFPLCPGYDFIWDTIITSIAPGEEEEFYYSELVIPCNWREAKIACFYACAPNGQLDATPENNSACSDFLLSTDNTDDIEVLISPNPVLNALKIEMPLEGVDYVQILDINGKKIYSHHKPSAPLSIDCSTWSSGVYLVQVSEAHRTWTGKVVR